MDLEEVENFDWLAPDFKLVHYRRQFGHMSVSVFLNNFQIDNNYDFFDVNGSKLTLAEIHRLIMNSVPRPEDPEDLVGKIESLNLYIQTVDWTVRDSHGRVSPVDHVEVQTTVTMIKSVSEAQKHRYSGGGKNYSIATAESQIGGRRGKFVIVKTEDDLVISIQKAP